jgi:hypothetical protein
MKKVGPVLEEHGSSDKYKGQFIAAGYGGHGMPRTFAWFVLHIDAVLHQSTDQCIYQCSSRCSNGCQRDFCYGMDHPRLATEALSDYREN